MSFMLSRMMKISIECKGKITTAAEWCMFTFDYQKTHPCDNLVLSDKQRNAHHLMLLEGKERKGKDMGWQYFFFFFVHK